MKKENNNELLKLKRKFSPKYILTEKMLEMYIIFILFFVLCLAANKLLYGFLAIIILAFIVFFKLVFEKRKSNQTVMKFYEDRIEFKGYMFFLKIKERVLKYDEIKDITFTQGATFLEKRFQKSFGYGNIYVYPKKGSFISNGMQIELVEDIQNRVEDIKNIVGDKLNNG